MREPGWDVKLLNLGSAHEGWLQSVRGLLGELMDPEVLERAVPTVPFEDLDERLRSLRFVCLVDDLTLFESRQAFPERGRPGEPDEDLYGLLGRLRDAPVVDGGEEQPKWPRPEALRPVGEFSELLGRGLHEARWAAGHEPHHGEVGEEQAVGRQGAGVDVLVDCYGLYVGSLHGWAAGLGRSRGNAGIEAMFRNHPDYREADGPAVLLSPELISTLYRLVMSRAPRPVRYYLAPERAPDLIFLKLVLLHEIGHHVYPVHGRASKNVSEAFANWFAYGFLNPGERAVMHEKTETQTVSYQMYEGLLSLLHPVGNSSPWAAAMPWNLRSGGDLVSSLERAALDGVLGDGATLASSRWGGLPGRVSEGAALWSAVSETPQLQPLLRSMAPGEGLHPAKALAWILLSEAVPDQGGDLARAMYDLQYAGRGPWRPMSQVRQYAWLNAAWSSPRIHL